MRWFSILLSGPTIFASDTEFDNVRFRNITSFEQRVHSLDKDIKCYIKKLQNQVAVQILNYAINMWSARGLLLLVMMFSRLSSGAVFFVVFIIDHLIYGEKRLQQVFHRVMGKFASYNPMI